ncbi:hypothetical protein J4E91_008767 [Alternaria rosae]|nr:hypothetical protein J4E91_008767 [Alternaria rosae]
MTQEELHDSKKELERYLARSGNPNVIDVYQTRLGSDFTDRDASKKLSFAVRTGHYSLVTALLDDPNVNGNDEIMHISPNFAPIHLAAMLGRTKVMECLIAHDRINVNLRDSLSRQALQIAASNGHTAIMKQLIGHPNVDVNCQDERGATPLHCAASNGHNMVVAQLIRHPGVNVNCQNYNAATPLHCAASNGHNMVVAQLIRHPGVNVNCQDENAATLLHYAASNGHWETASLLLKHSESMEDGRCTSYDVPPITLPFSKEDLLHRLLQHPDFGGPNTILPGKYRNMLNFAATKGDCEVIELLLAYPDIDLNVPNRYGQTPLMNAVKHGRLEAHGEIVDLLLSHGAIDYDAKASTTVPTTAHTDDAPITTLQPDHENHFDSFDDGIDDTPTEAWEEFLAMEEGMAE